MNAGRPSRPLLSRPGQPRRRTTAVHAAILAALLQAAAAVAATDVDTLLAVPDDAARLIPPGSALVVAIASLDEADAEWQGLAAAFGSSPTDKDYSLLSAFGDGLPGFAGVVRRDQPLLVAVGLAGLVMGGGLDFTFVFPFHSDLTQLRYQGPGSPFVNLQQSGGYAALSSSTALRPLSRPTALALPQGIISATVDLGLSLKLALPLLEIGMAQLTVAKPDSTGAMQPPLIDPQDLPAINASLRTVAGSLTRLDLTIGRDGERYVTRNRLHVVPGSPLSPGPQPSFTEAAQLTALLPAGGDLMQVAAMDFTRPFAVFEPLYLSDMRRTAAQLPPDAARDYVAWYADYLGLVPLTAQPVAATLNVTGDGAVVHAVMKTRNGKEAFTRVTGLLDRLSALPVPLRLEPLEEEGFKGAEVRAYHVVLDARTLLAPVPGAAAGSPQAAQVQQVAQVADLFGRLIPEIRLARTGRYLLASADRNREALAGMIRACRDDDERGRVDPRPADAAARGDGHVQEVIAGDLTAMWRWFAGLADNVDGAPALPPLTELDPLPCEMTMSAWDGGFSGTFAVSRDDLLRLAQALSGPGR
jgi:hypothetical protein